MKLAAWARILSRSWLIGPLPDRWERCRLAAREAERIAPAYGDEGELLIAAAYLHDIGRAPDLAATGCPALDGARYLLTTSGPTRLAQLVAHQPCSAADLADPSITAALADFIFETGPVRDAFWYCLVEAGPPDARRAALADVPDVAAAIFRAKAKTVYQRAS